MNSKHKFSICFFRDYMVENEDVFSADSEEEAEEKCYDENATLDDIEVFRVAELGDGSYMVEYSYWAYEDDKCEIEAYDEEEAVKLFHERHSSFDIEEFDIKSISDLGSEDHFNMKDLEAKGQMNLDLDLDQGE